MFKMIMKNSGPIPFLTNMLNDGVDQFLELGKALEELSKQRQNEEEVRALINVVLGIDYSKIENKDDVGYFLVESMRLCNFTLHDGGYLNKFKSIFEKIGIKWTDGFNQCIELTTFSSLGYKVDGATGGGYVYAEP